jgi:putative ABC transport system permease protein
VSAAGIARSSLQAADVIRVGSVGLRTRRLRAALSAIGVAIGIASMVAVVGISASSKADLLATLDRLGTNLLAVKPGQSFFGAPATLPKSAPATIRRGAGVTAASPVENLPKLTVRRTNFIDKQSTNAIAVGVASASLLQTVSATVADGSFLKAANGRFPTVVLGAAAAARLGIDRVGSGVQVWIDNRWFTVVGIMRPVTLAPELDSYAFVGAPYARRAFGADGSPSYVYVRADPDQVKLVAALLGPTANPEHPDEVDVSRPSDALAARAAAKTAFTALLLGLGAVALLVGGVGIANVMVISVLERRSEIGLRRAIGATRRHIALQFLTESIMLGALGGVGGAALGALATAAYDHSRGWAVVVPGYALVAAVAVAIAIGALAGLYPATRAARLAPTEALRTV